MENAVAESPMKRCPWTIVLEQLETELSPGIYNTWFRPTQLLAGGDECLEVSVPNEMFAEWLRSQYMAQIRTAMQRGGLRSREVRFVPPRRRDPGAKEPARVAVTEQPAPEPPRLNPRYTFENFVVSSCNQFAHAAALATTSQLGGAYNPLFVYGGVGLGKTHLMQAIGNAWLRTNPDIRLRYLTCEQFINELITSIRLEKMQDFRDRYRSVDILLVDDIQFIAGKESTQEEFFHTFNALYDAGHQIVLASDAPPRAIPSLAERLRSRFEWGLIADIQPPDLETKVAILNKVAAARGWELPPEVGLFLASQIQTNIRELEGGLTTLMAAASIQRRPVDLKLAREVIRAMAPAEDEPVSLDAVARVAARHFNLKISDLKSKTNAHRIAYPRQIAMYLGKQLAKESYPTIGKFFGGKHHTTVLHAVRKVNKLRAEDSSVHKLLNQLEEELR